jgi:hypothetical protein
VTERAFRTLLSDRRTRESARGARGVLCQTRRRLTTCATIALLLATSVVSRSPGAQPSEGVINREYPLKAAYLYNFANFVEWPAAAFASADAPFVIGVMDPDPFGGVLDELAATKKVGTRRIVVLHFANADQLKPCQLLFIGPTVTKAQCVAALARLGDAAVLTVSDSESAVSPGATIHFVTENNRIRFTVNAGLAKRRDLKISSKILALAKMVNNN